MLPLSCFALTELWTPERLSDGTGFVQYRLARAATLLEAGLAVWPTEVFNDGVPDPRNEVHYDLIVAAGPGLIPTTLVSGTPAERRAARAEAAPPFERALAVLGEPRAIGQD